MRRMGGVVVGHTYAAPGMYDVTVTVCRDADHARCDSEARTALAGPTDGRTLCVYECAGGSAAASGFESVWGAPQM